MPCVNADGTITTSGRHILKVALQPVAPVDVARQTGIPLFHVRGALRELIEAGLIRETDGQFQITEAGTARLPTEA